MMMKRRLWDGHGDQPVLFKDLMAAVGHFLFYWGLLEQNLSDAIWRLKSESGKRKSSVQGSLQDRLDQWRKLVAQTRSATDIKFAKQLAGEVEDLRMDRNIIVHGLIAGNARPDLGDPYIECRESGYDNPTGGKRRYTLAELAELAEKADSCRLKFTPNYRQATSSAPMVKE